MLDTKYEFQISFINLHCDLYKMHIDFYRSIVWMLGVSLGPPALDLPQQSCAAHVRCVRLSVWCTVSDCDLDLAHVFVCTPVVPPSTHLQDL